MMSTAKWFGLSYASLRRNLGIRVKCYFKPSKSTSQLYGEPWAAPLRPLPGVHAPTAREQADTMTDTNVLSALGDVAFEIERG